MRKINALILFISCFTLSCFTGCDFENNPTLNLKNEFTLDSVKYTLDETIWVYNQNYGLNVVSATKDSITSFILTLPDVVEKGITYSGEDVEIMIENEDLPIFTSYDDVIVKITNKTKKQIEGTFSGTFFYVYHAQTQDVSISGTFSAKKE